MANAELTRTPGTAEIRGSSARRLVKTIDGKLRSHLDRYDIAFVVLMALVFALAFRTIASQPSIPGADIGNYLLTMRQVFGDDPTGLGLQRPPLIAVPLKIATTLLPLIIATKVVAMLVWLFAGFTGYLLIKKITGGGVVGNTGAVIGGLSYLLTTRIIAMAVWGWITLLGIALVTIIALLILRGNRDPTWKSAALVGAAIAILAGTHQVSLFVALWWMSGYTLALLAFRRWKELIFILKSGLLALAFSSWLIPLYIKLTANATGDSVTAAFRSLDEIKASFSFFYDVPDPGVWIALAVMAMIGLGMLAVEPTWRKSALVLGSMLLTFCLLIFAPGVWGARALFYAYLPIVALATVTLVAAVNWMLFSGLTRTGQRITAVIVTGALAGFVIFLHSGFQDSFNKAVRFWSLTTDSHLEAASYISEITPNDATFIAHPYYTGWWLEGALGRNAFEIGKFAGKKQNEQASIALSVLTGNHVISNGMILAGHSFPEQILGTPQMWLALPRNPGGGWAAQAYLDDVATMLTIVDQEVGAREVSLQEFAQVFQVVHTDESISLVNTFTGEGITITQTTTLKSGEHAWRVEYVVDGGGKVRSMVIPIYFVGVKATDHLDDDKPSFRMSQGIKSSTIEGLVRLSGVNDDIGSEIELPDRDPTSRADEPVLVTMVPRAGKSRLSIDFTGESVGQRNLNAPRYHPVDREEAELEYTRAKDLVVGNGIDYAVVSGLPPFVTERLNSSPSFEALRLEDNIYIYELKPDGFPTVSTTPGNRRTGWAFWDNLRDVQFWTGFRADNIRKINMLTSETNARMIAADVHIEPGIWSGITFNAPDTFDGSDLHQMSTRIRWGSLKGLDTLSIALEDADGNRWAWHRDIGQVSQNTDGWQVWDVSRREATREDDSFAWNRVIRLHVSALASSDAHPSENSIEIMHIQSSDELWPSPASALRRSELASSQRRGSGLRRDEP